MAKRRSIAELRRNLKRRLLSASLDQVERTARDLREFAVASRFYRGFSVGYIEENHYITGAMSRIAIEDAIRGQGARRR